MSRVQTIVRAEARRKVEWQQAAKDAGLNLNAWMVNALDQAAGVPVDIETNDATKARWQAAAKAARMSLNEFVVSTIDWAIEEHPNTRGAPADSRSHFKPDFKK